MIRKYSVKPEHIHYMDEKGFMMRVASKVKCEGGKVRRLCMMATRKLLLHLNISANERVLPSVLIYKGTAHYRRIQYRSTMRYTL